VALHVFKEKSKASIATQRDEHDKQTSRYFIEIGAVNGRYLSNKLTLEDEFGWQGLCVEPSSHYADLVLSGRSCAMANECLAGEGGKVVTFMESVHPESEQGQQLIAAGTDIEAASLATDGFEMATDGFGVYSGMLDFFKRYKVIGVQKEMTTKSLMDVLKEYDAPHHIDYLSIDTEGSELDILTGFFIRRREDTKLVITP
jgi:hypothetical protein